MDETTVVVQLTGVAELVHAVGVALAVVEAEAEDQVFQLAEEEDD